MKKPSKSLWVAVVFACVVLDPTSSRAQAPSMRPNIVVILADDMGYGDIGIHGSKDIPTPNIDSLANNGVRFTNGYVSSPLCSPSRAGLMTGRYQERFGHELNPTDRTPSNEVGLPLTEKTIADRLRAAGYKTGMVGKWHLGGTDQFHPMNRGFDEFFGFLAGAHPYFKAGEASDNPILDGKTIVKPGFFSFGKIEYLTDLFAKRATEYIARHKSEPFFLYLAFNAVHSPLQAPDMYLKRFEGIADKQRRTYAAMLSAMDDGIGRVLATLREHGLEENTLVFFINDNGGPTMQETAVNGSSNAPLRGSKRQTYEGGIRVPFLVQWKGRLDAGKTYAHPIIQLDVLPTALAAAGVELDPAWKLDGVDLLPYLTGENKGAPHEVLYWRLGGTMAVRKGDWKVVRTFEGALTESNPETLKDLSQAGLYNLTEDIGESTNVAAKYPEKFKELSQVWQEWNQELATPLWGMNSPEEKPGE